MPISIDEGTGRGIVLVHGQPGSGADWAPLVQLLSGDYRVLAPDRPGWGQNTGAATGLRANAAWLADWLDAGGEGGNGAVGKVTVVGHSLGGGIALELALARPDLVGSLVLLGSVGVDVAVSVIDRVLALPRLGDPIIRAGIGAVRTSRRASHRLNRTSLVGRAADRLSNGPTVRALAWLDERPIDERTRASFLVEQRAFLDETPTLEQRLPTISVPTVVVHGTADWIVPRAAVHLLAERIPGAEFVTIGGEGHLVPFERPELIAPIVRRYAQLGG